MNWRRRIFLFAVLLPFAGTALHPAHAQTRVGEAVLVQNEVARMAGTLSMPINVGDGLLRDETVRTGQESAAKLVLADNTNLSLGPNATITLDRTVFNDEHSYRDIAIRLATGAFRFVTGHSEKAAYKITTSVATIGVRGTILDILSQPGKTAIITSAGIQKTNTPPWTFASSCGAAAGLCSVTNFADATPPGDGSDPTGMLCGR